MTVLRVAIAEDFKGESVVLMATDSAGLHGIVSALSRVIERPNDTVVLGLADGRELHVALSNKNLMQFEPGNVLWNLNADGATQTLEGARRMLEAPYPCHNYFEIDAPTETLVIAKDEYL